MSHRYDCPDEYEARREGEQAARHGYGSYSNPYDGAHSRDSCEEAEAAWRRGHRDEERRIEERHEEEAAAGRRANQRRLEVQQQEEWEQEEWEQERQQQQEPQPEEPEDSTTKGNQ